MLCGVRYAISDCHVIDVHVHVYNMSNLITRTSVGYHYNKQALHIGPSTLHTVWYLLQHKRHAKYLLLDIRMFHASPLCTYNPHLPHLTTVPLIGLLHIYRWLDHWIESVHHNAQCRSVHIKSHFPNGKFQKSNSEFCLYSGKPLVSFVLVGNPISCYFDKCIFLGTWYMPNQCVYQFWDQSIQHWQIYKICNKSYDFLRLPTTSGSKVIAQRVVLMFL